MNVNYVGGKAPRMMNAVCVLLGLACFFLVLPNVPRNSLHNYYLLRGLHRIYSKPITGIKFPPYSCRLFPVSCDVTCTYMRGMLALMYDDIDLAARIWQEKPGATNRAISRMVNLYQDSSPEVRRWLEAVLKSASSSCQQRLANYYAGQIYFDSGDYYQSVTHYFVALDYVVTSCPSNGPSLPSDSDIYVEIARVEVALGTVREARRHLMLAVESNPSNATAWHEVGILLHDHFDDTTGALDALRAADRLEPDDPWHLITAARYLRQAGDLSAAMQLYNILFDRGIRHHWVYVGMAQIYTEQGEYLNARNIALECASKSTWSWFDECWVWSGIASLYLQEYKAADQYFVQALKKGASLQSLCKRVNDLASPDQIPNFSEHCQK